MSTKMHLKRWSMSVLGALLCIVVGLIYDAFWGIEGSQQLAVGTTTSTFHSAHGNSEIPLGFNLRLERRIDEFGPIDLRIAVHDRSSKAFLGLIELREGGEEVALSDKEVYLRLERLDEEIGLLYLRGRTPNQQTAFTMPLDFQGGAPTELNNYQFFLSAYKFPTAAPTVRTKVAILEEQDLVFETWLEPESKVSWRGFQIYQSETGKTTDGTPYVLIGFAKMPGRIFFWLAPLVFLAVLLPRRVRTPASDTLGHDEATNVGSLRKPPRYFVILAAFISLLLLEGGARIIEFGRDFIYKEQNPYLELKNPQPLFEIAVQNGQRIYRRTSHQPLVVDNQTFLADKPGNGYRVFLIGGSAAAGWPYETGAYNTARFLALKLERLYPERQVEVILAAGGTYGSHRVKMVFDEIINYQPDLVLIYSGNNEFLENIVYRRQAPPGIWKHLALARLSFELYSQSALIKPQLYVDSYSIADQRSNRIAFAFGKASHYRRDPEQFLQLQDHFRYNIEHMVRKCLDQGVAVMLLNVPVNLKDWVPNASQHKAGLTTDELTSWQDYFRAGLLSLEQGKVHEAVTALKNASEIDEEHAETRYLLGRALLRSGAREQAKKEFVAALERDAYPFRAVPQFQQIIVDTASKARIPLVDIVAALERETEDGIIGRDVLLDYVHPSEQSQEVIAQEIVRVLSTSTLGHAPLGQDLGMDDRQIPIDFRARDEAYAIEALYSQYLIMRQYDKLAELYQQLVRTMRRAMTEDPSLATFCQRGIDIADTLQPIVQDYAQLLRAEKLGLLKQTFSHDEAQAIYQRYIDMIQALEAPDMSREAFLLQIPKLHYPDQSLRQP